jgi:hypothetical protein
MPITPFLNGVRFDLEGERVRRVAFEMVCIGLRTGSLWINSRGQRHLSCRRAGSSADSACEAV